VTIKCPGAKDTTETGGHYSLYTGALDPNGAPATVTCN
jgi:hypothetical protein